MTFFIYLSIIEKMKIKGLVLACLFALPLCGCESSKGAIKLTYGSEIDEEATQIRTGDLQTMCENKESFILVLYPGEDSTCTCWTTFSRVINEYVTKETRIIYKMNGLSLSDKNDYDLSIRTDRPTLSIFNEGKKEYEWIYDSKSTQSYFKKESDLEDQLNEYTVEPSLIYIDEDRLSELVSSKKTFHVMYEWSTCPDCQYCLPEVVIPWLRENETSTTLYVIDLAVEGILISNGVSDKNNKSYIDFMTKYGLNESGNETYGYTEVGVVPTFQYRVKGEIEDAAVYFNDEVSYDESKGYYISNSFYSEERITNLKYLGGDVTPLLGMSVSETELDINGDSISPIKSEFAKYHTPLLKAYFEYYFK